RRVDRYHVGARHHHLADDRVVELEDRVDELAVALLEHVELGRLVDHAEQLLLARDAREADPAGGPRVAEGAGRFASGPRSTRRKCTRGAERRRTVSACARPTLLGLAPTSTND